MMSAAIARRAEELAAGGTAFVTATVVRAQRPTSVKAGDVALVLGDGTIEGFVGGECAQQSVRVYSLKAIESGEAMLLRIVPDGPVGEDPGTGREIPVEDGAVTAQNPCLSGGSIEIFLEPVLPAPRLLVVGDTPIAAAVIYYPRENLFTVSPTTGTSIPSPIQSQPPETHSGQATFTTAGSCSTRASRPPSSSSPSTGRRRPTSCAATTATRWKRSIAASRHTTLEPR